LGCTQLNTCTVLYTIVTLSAEFVTCLLSPSLSPLHLLGIPCKSAHLLRHYTQLMHSVMSLLLVNLLVVLQAHNGCKYEHRFLYELTQKTAIMTRVSATWTTLPPFTICYNLLRVPFQTLNSSYYQLGKLRI